MKMEIVLASRNPKKIYELEHLLNTHLSIDVKILSLDDIGYTKEIAETGKTFEENAYIKAAVPAKLGYIGISDDSGLEVDVLSGRPGIFSSRYAGENKDDEDNNNKLLLELLNIPAEKRTARFVCVITCVFPDTNDIISVRGTCEGLIIDTPRGSNGFGYDPIFYCEEFGRTFAELTDDEKNSISHRGKAINLFIKEFRDYIRSNYDK